MKEKKYIIYDVLNNSIVGGTYKNERDANHMAYQMSLSNNASFYHVMPLNYAF